TLLVENSTKAKAADQAMYARFVQAATKLLGDPRVPTTQATKLRSQLIEPGIIYRFMRTDAIAIPGGGDAVFTTVFPPEEAVASTGASAASVAVPFTANKQPIKWKELSVSDPKGMQKLDMPDNSVVYLVATCDAKIAGNAYLTCGSDDGLHV